MMKFGCQAQNTKNAPKKKRKERTFLHRQVAVMLVLVTICMITLPAFSFSSASSNLLLDCPLSVHEHGQGCYDEAGELICGEADYVVHVHAEGCWDEAGNLLCQLPEIAPNGQLELHTHSPENCYDPDGQLICGKTALYEHVHGDGCFREVELEETGNRDEEIVGDVTGSASDDEGMLPEDVTVPAPDEEGDVTVPASDDEGDVTGSAPNEEGDITISAPDEKDDVCVTASYKEGVFPQGARLRVNSVEDEDLEFYGTLRDTLREKLLTLRAIYPYDISVIDADGTELQPEEDGTVTVTMAFKEPVAKKMDVSTWRLLHITDTGIENMEDIQLEDKDIQVDENGDVTSVTFTVDHFSRFVLADVVEPRALEGYLEGREDGDFSFTLRLNGEIVPEQTGGGYSLIPGNTYQVEIRMRSANGVEPGMYFYNIPSGVQLDPDLSSGKITSAMNGDGDPVGRWYISDDGLLVVEFNEETDFYTGLLGYINWEFTIPDDDDAEERVDADLKKRGYFDLSDGMFHFEITATIPAYDPNYDVEYYEWYIEDRDSVRDSDGVPVEYPIFQSLEDVTVTLQYNEDDNKRIITVPDIKVADDGDVFAFYYKEEGAEGSYPVGLYLLSRSSEPDCCGNLGNLGLDIPGWCTHWKFRRNAELIINYATSTYGNGNDAKSILDNYGGDEYVNSAMLNHLVNGSGNRRDKAVEAPVDVPVLVKKSGPVNASGFDPSSNTATFTIIINESLKDLSSQNELKIVDEMNNLLFVPGTLIIERVAEDEKSEQLKYNEDYTIDWEPDGQGNGVLTITLLDPGQFKYIIQYDAMINTDVLKEEGDSAAYSNKATLLFSGWSISGEHRGTFTRSSGFMLERVQVIIHKADINDGTPLSGAIYDLYAADGYKITTGEETNAAGEYAFATSVSRNIILRSGLVYYLLESKAPSGYNLDPDLHYFYFSSVQDKELEESYAEQDIYLEWLKLDEESTSSYVANKTLEDVPGPILPNAGGAGTLPFYLLGGFVLIVDVFYFGSTSRKKRISNP